MVAILPFVEEQNLKDTIPRGLLVTNVNQTLFRPPSVFRCPRRTTIDGDSLQSIWPGHYVFVPASGRESFFVFDAPVELTVPWVIGPEMVYDKIVRKKGPHSDGFHFARGFQQGVSFMLNREEMR